MKRTNILAALLVALSLITTGCGTSDYVQSIALTATTPSSGGGFFNLAGWGSNLQLKVTAIYHSGKSVDVTNSVTYTVTPQGVDDTGATLQTPPNTVRMNTTGQMTAVDPTVCTWTDLTPPPGTPPSWFLTGSYQVIATYHGMASQPIFVGVASAASINGPDGACGPV